jgi:phosphoenolpyruvate---glycerone phosphotransferase subunit DhaL
MERLNMDETVGTAALDRWVRSFALLVAENKDLLTDLDAAIGDGDHGANMDRGMGASFGETAEISLAQLAAALRAGLDGIVARGKAEAGDKTMYDALAPAVNALDSAVSEGLDNTDALKLALVAAENGRDATTPMLARKGRASYLGERSVGHQDPGATTVALLMAAATQASL